VKYPIQGGHLVTILIVLIFSQAASQQNSWQWTGGPYWGAAKVLTMNTNGHIFAGTASGICRSTDNGDNWALTTQALGRIDVRTLVIKSNGYIFAGTYDGRVILSTDNGGNWSSVSTGLPQMAVMSIVIRRDGQIYAGTDSGGVFRSTNDGASWTSINQGLMDTHIYSLAADTNNRIYANIASGVFYSTNDGTNWISTQGTMNLPTGLLTLDPQGVLFLRDPRGSLYRSQDSGCTWIDLSQRIDTFYFRGQPVVDYQFILYSNIVFDSRGELIVWNNNSSYDKIFMKSTNGGDKWISMDTIWMGSSYENIYSLAINPNNGYVFTGTSAGMLRSTDDGANWINVNRELATRSISSMAINSNGNIFISSDSGVYRSTNNGDQWIQKNQGLPLGGFPGNIWSIAINPLGNIFAGASSGGVFRSTDNGENWQWIKNYGYIIAINSNGHIFTGSYIAPICRSTNNGISWTVLDSTSFLFANCFAFNSSGHIFAGSYYSNGNDRVVSRSTNNGDSWTALTQGFPTSQLHTYYRVNALAVNSLSSIFAGTDSGMFRSTNNGDNWSRIENGLPPSIGTWSTCCPPSIVYYGPPQIRTIATNSVGYIFIAYDRGVYRSTDNGDTWTMFNLGLSQSDTVNVLAVNLSGYLYGATSTGSVFRSASPTTSVGNSKINVPLHYILEQNYPNPFNPTTAISFQLPVLSKVSLKIFDVLGREVMTLVNEEEPAGSYEVQWNAEKMTTGIYFCQFKAGSYMQTRKMLLLK